MKKISPFSASLSARPPPRGAAFCLYACSDVPSRGRLLQNKYVLVDDQVHLLRWIDKFGGTLRICQSTTSIWAQMKVTISIESGALY